MNKKFEKRNPRKEGLIRKIIWFIIVRLIYGAIILSLLWAIKFIVITLFISGVGEEVTFKVFVDSDREPSESDRKKMTTAVDNAIKAYNKNGGKDFRFIYMGITDVDPCFWIDGGLTARLTTGEFRDPIIILSNRRCVCPNETADDQASGGGSKPGCVELRGICLAPAQVIYVSRFSEWPAEELEAILTHEIGHYYIGHVRSGNSVMVPGTNNLLWPDDFKAAVRYGTIGRWWPLYPPSRD